MSTSVRMALLVPLCVCYSLLIHSPSSLAGPLGPPELHGPGAKFGGVYRRVLHNNPSTLDPAFSTDVYGRAVVHQIFDGLVQFNADLKPLPALAEFWEASRDGRTWTFTLRRGVKFHHGREVTAYDFISSFTRLLRVRSPTSVINFFEQIQGATECIQGKAPHIEGPKAIDRYTLQIGLEEPLGPALAVLGLAHAAVVPQEEMERLAEGFGRAPVGTGPFTFVRWEPNREIVLEANKHYYEGRPFLDAIVFKVALGGEFEETFAEFLQGNLEETTIPGGRIDEVHTNPKYQQYQRVRIPIFNFVYIGFNMQRKLFDDRRVRQAFNYAVNTEVIVREISRMGNLPATGALPPGMLAYDPDRFGLPSHAKGYSYHPEKAKRLLAEAGYPEGAGFPLLGRRTMPMKKIWFEKSLPWSSMSGMTDGQPNR